MAVFRIILMIWLFLVMLPHFAHAQETSPFQTDMFFATMQKMPVLHDGRIKPFGRAAQITFQKINGTRIPLNTATALITHIMFDPVSAQDPKLFHIADVSLRHVLKLPDRAAPYYSFREMNTAFVGQAELIASLRNIPPQTLTDQQNALLDVYANVIYFEQIIGSATLFLPLKDTQQRSIVTLKPSDYTPAIQDMIDRGIHQQEWRIITINDTFISPWQAFLAPNKDTDGNTMLTLWQDVADAYNAYDASAWARSVDALYNASTTAQQRMMLETEISYITYDPDFISLVFYTIATLLALVLIRRTHKKTLFAATYIFCVLGWVLQAVSLAMRMIILQRPPVSDLYESFLFVGFLMVSGALVYLLRHRDHMILFFVALFAVLLQIFARTIHPEFDSFKVLQAVLNTQFWLATHVVLITAGYAFCLLTSIMAHAQIVTQRWFTRAKAVTQNTLYRRTYGMALIALFLMVSGTALGGIWADQSWGRFWGWDPKENGALLIIIWLVWLLHGKISRHINENALMLGCAGLSLMVALSWIGTNLLGVGLHSYGFIDSVATALLVLILLEAAFLIYVWLSDRKRGRVDA